jgi:hypothetical protein
MYVVSENKKLKLITRTAYVITAVTAGDQAAHGYDYDSTVFGM